MYTDDLVRVTNPVTGESRLMGPVGARAHLAEYKHMRERVLDLLATGHTQNPSPLEQAREAQRWDKAFKFDGWIAAIEEYLSGGAA